MIHVAVNLLYSCYVATDLTSNFVKIPLKCSFQFRDGLERVEIPETGTLGELKCAIRDKLGIPGDDIALSQDPKLVRTPLLISYLYLYLYLYSTFRLRILYNNYYSLRRKTLTLSTLS